uniref:Transmembrane protein n=2 Tax=Schistocephalus solidus TaxID=70667 RepID=A0A0X3NSL4_SCHSO
MEVAQDIADESDSGETLGAYIALAVLFLIHLICWIVSIVKAIRDRKLANSHMEDTKARQGLVSVGSEHLDSEKDKSEAPGVKFALTHSDQAGAGSPAANRQRSEPVKHHFARSLQRVLSTGNAKRVTAEELAIMLDSYSVPPAAAAATGTTISRPPPSPRPIPSPTVEIELDPAIPQAQLA